MYMGPDDGQHRDVVGLQPTWRAQDGRAQVAHEVLQVVEVRVEDVVEEVAEVPVASVAHDARFVVTVSEEPGAHGRLGEIEVYAGRVRGAGVVGADVHEDVEEGFEVVPSGMRDVLGVSEELARHKAHGSLNREEGKWAAASGDRGDDEPSDDLQGLTYLDDRRSRRSRGRSTCPVHVASLARRES